MMMMVMMTMLMMMMMMMMMIMLHGIFISRFPVVIGQIQIHCHQIQGKASG